MLSVARAILQLLSRRRGDRADVHPARLPIGGRPDGAHARRGRAPRRPAARRRAARAAGGAARQRGARATTSRRCRRGHRGGGDRPAGRALPGPLYGFYKAASAIAVARALEAESGVRCVPLFWLQTEDHDFAEIASATVAGRGGAAGHAVAPRRAGRRRRASRSRTAGCRRRSARCSTRSPSCWAPARPRAETLALLARALPRRAPDRGRRSPASSAELFADEGLLILDPRERARRRAGRADLPRGARRAPPTIERRLDERARGARGGRLRASRSRSAPGCALVFGHRDAADRPALSAGAPARARRRSAWRLAGGDGGFADAGDRRRAGARAAPLLHLGAAAADRAGHAAADGGLRRRPGGGQLLRAARAALRALPPGDAAGRPARALSLSRPAHAPAPGRARPRAPTTSRARRPSCSRGCPARAPRGTPSAAELAARVASEIAPVVDADRRHRRRARSRATATSRAPPSARARTSPARSRGSPGATRASWPSATASPSAGSRACRTRSPPAASRRSAPTPGRRSPAGSAPPRSRRWCSSASPPPARSRRRCRISSHEHASRPRRRSGSASSASRPSAAAASSPPRSPPRSRARGHAVHVFSDDVPGRLDPAQPNVTFHRVAPARLPAAQTLALHAGAHLEDRRGRRAASGSTSCTPTTPSPTPSAPTWRARCWPPTPAAGPPRPSW